MTWNDREVLENKPIRARGRDEACARLIRAQTSIQVCSSTRRRLTQEVITCERDLMIGAPAIGKGLCRRGTRRVELSEDNRD